MKKAPHSTPRKTRRSCSYVSSLAFAFLGIVWWSLHQWGDAIDSKDQQFKVEDSVVSVSNSGQLLSSSSSSSAAALSPLRFDWSRISLKSPIAKQLWDLQHNCSLPVANYEWRDGHGGGYGLGSDLHAWGNALRYGINQGHRIQSPNPWIWIDQQHCTNSSLFSCYFPEAEPSCPNQVIRGGRFFSGPCTVMRDWRDNFTIPDFRAAATEFAFSALAPAVVREAERQVKIVFGEDISIPRESLITVHVRWGDKALEGARRNIAIQQYIDKIDTLVQEEKLESVHILLCTEDPKALDAFRDASADRGWAIHVDHFYTEYLPFRKDREVIYNVPSHITMETKGKSGLWAMGSLLVAMEANYFVLTTTSNWSRLMNELRKSILDPRCNGCTRMVDLAPGEC